MSDVTGYELGIRGLFGWKRITVSNHRVQTEIDGQPIPARLLYQTLDGHVVSLPGIDQKTWCVYAKYWDHLKAFKENVNQKVSEKYKAAQNEIAGTLEKCQETVDKKDQLIATLQAERDLFAVKAEESTRRFEALSVEVEASRNRDREELQRLEQEYAQRRGQGWPATADQRNI